ncbi:MAG TPA: DUF3127 domain-containing protein [Bacteroidia bacterium]|nr:DUF3127 domain-containing protein [Bacteroidia bacterium]
MFNITGILKVKGKEQQISEKFKKREFVITDNSSQYPQHISFQLTQDKCSLMDTYNVGDELKVFFNLRGREWTAKDGELKYFNSLEAWKLEGNSKTAANASSNETANPVVSEQQAEDDLPF